MFVEVTLQKAFNQNYVNKLSLDYATFEDIVEKAVSSSYRARKGVPVMGNVKMQYSNKNRNTTLETMYM